MRQQVFSLRAQNRAAIDRFLSAARRAPAALSDVKVHKDANSPSAELEFKTELNRHQLDGLLLDSQNTGLMRRTLRAVSLQDNCMTFGPTVAQAA